MVLVLVFWMLMNLLCFDNFFVSMIFSMFWKISYVYENYVWVNIPFYLCFRGFTMFQCVVSRGFFFLIANTCSWDICWFQVYLLLLRKMMKSLYPMPLKCHHYLHPFIKFNNDFINQRVDEDRNLDFFEMITSTNELARNLVNI